MAHNVQDKKALEDRLKEVQTILETVQNQRNELRQLYKVGPDPSAPAMGLLLHALQAALCNFNGTATGRSALVCMCPGARSPQHRCRVGVLCFESCACHPC